MSMNIQNTIEDVYKVSNKYLKLNDDTISNESDICCLIQNSQNQNLFQIIKKPILIMRFRKVVICILFAKRMLSI